MMTLILNITISKATHIGDTLIKINMVVLGIILKNCLNLTIFPRGMSPFERVAAGGHKSIQLNCGWHGSDRNWKGGTYAGTPNDNLGGFLLVKKILFCSS